MAVAIATNGKAAVSTLGTSATATFPSAHTAVAGRLLLVFAGTNGYPPNYALVTPTGYTSLANLASSQDDKRVVCFAKVAAGGETGVTVGHGGAGPTTIGVHIFEISGVDAAGIVAGTTSIDATTVDKTSPATATIASPAVDPASALDVLFLFFAYTINALGALSWSNTFATETSDTSKSFVGSRIITGPGSTTTTATYTNNGTAAGIVVAVPSAATSNTAPTADAGVDQTNVVIGTDVALDGSNSFDAETASTSLTYSWAVTSAGTTGLTTGDIAGASSRTTTMATTGKTAGTATITLTVTDAGALTDTDTMTVTLIDAPSGSINGWIWNGTTWLAM